MKSRQGQDIQVNCAFMLDLDKSMPQTTSTASAYVSECDDSKSLDDVTCESSTKYGKRVTFAPSVGSPDQDHSQTRKTSTPRSAKDVLRERIRGAKIKRRQKRTPRRHVIEILKGKFCP